jgi:hypothetical protein
MRAFIGLWFKGYINPVAFATGLAGRPAPYWGFSAQLLRALLDSLLLYLPLSLLGRIPPTPSYIPWIDTGHYYGFLVLLTPLVFTVQWLLGGAAIHLLLKMNQRASDFDLILNLTGMVTLVVGTFLLLWDWLWIGLGGINQYWLGTSHLLIDIWALVLISVGLKKILHVPVLFALIATLVSIAVTFPLAVIFMRSPL